MKTIVYIECMWIMIIVRADVQQRHFFDPVSLIRQIKTITESFSVLAVSLYSQST